MHAERGLQRHSASADDLHGGRVRPLPALHGPRFVRQRLLQHVRRRGQLLLRGGLHERCDVWRRDVLDARAQQRLLLVVADGLCGAMRAAMTMRRHLSLAALLAPVLCGALTSDADAQINVRTVTLAINVAPHKPGGAAWDAFGGAPDVAICINSALGQRCFAAGNGTYASPSQFGRGRCQDSFACTFAVTVPATGPFSLSIYDVDLSEHDLIGSCAVTPNNTLGVGACGSATLVVR